MRAVRSTYARFPRLGPWLYVSAIQYFVVQFLVAIRFEPTYSVARNTISDLGNTTCDKFNGRPVCSPLHSVMNISFVVLGLAMITGSTLVYCAFAGRRAAAVGFLGFGLGGLGAVLVGLYPENTVPAFHGLGSALPFVIGNAGIVVLGVSLDAPRWLRRFTITIGCAALVGLAFYSSSQFLGLGEGGIERVVAYPQTVWMVVVGLYLLTRSRRLARSTWLAGLG